MYQTSKLYWPFLFVIDLIGTVLFFWKKLRRMPENPENILVIKVDHIGDMIMTSSFFRNLKRNYPNSNINVLCRSLTKDVAECIPSIDKIHVVDVPWFSRGQKNWKNFFAWIKHNKKAFDMVFELHTDPRNIIVASLVGKYSVGYGVRGMGFLLNKTVSWKNTKRHNVERNLDILEGIGKRIDDGHLELNIDNQYYESAKRKLNIILGKYVLCYPISGREEKNRSWDEWNDINQKLSKQFNLKLLYCGASSERDLIEKNIMFDKNKIFNVSGMFSLKESFALIQHSELVVSTDTFAVHACAALNKKVWIFDYPGYDIKIWGPFRLSKNKVVLLK